MSQRIEKNHAVGEDCFCDVTVSYPVLFTVKILMILVAGLYIVSHQPRVWDASNTL